ncbi:MAG: hypothetical protein COV99_04945 [Bacteroidetes bacterium CG12_big_fil_rev_8_21_14_0_65_60_17]|nr:MAG: hypothetical protein COV99_04945 [Bacteroidetes bacterium CG12_big_fil_rev_8_21_14_0_65_60_17]
MGQQQLLLLVFGVIIVGIAIIAGINVYVVNFDQALVDNIVNRNLEIANSAVFYKTKMDPYNGGNMSYELLGDSGLETLSMSSTTNFGTFAITNATETTLEITGIGLRNPDIGVRTYISGYGIDSSRVSYVGDITIE